MFAYQLTFICLERRYFEEVALLHLSGFLAVTLHDAGCRP